MVAGMRLPFPISGETPEQSEQRARAFEAGITDAGLGLFNDFFLVAMGVCLVAIVPAAFMFFRKTGRQPP
jgi:hypothetical protein